MNHQFEEAADAASSVFADGLNAPPVISPAAGQALVFADTSGQVALIFTDVGGAYSFYIDPDGARSIADRLYDAAYKADDGV